MSVLTVLFFVVGVVALVAGAEALVRGAARIAARTGLSSVVIGLTVVAFGTSAPELAVSLGAGFRDQADLAIGNVVGSNIANVLLVLGLSAVVGAGLVVDRRIVRIDVPIMVGLSLVLFGFSYDKQLERWEGAVLFVGLVVYIAWTVITTRRGAEAGESVAMDLDIDLDEAVLGTTSVWHDVGFVAAGLVLLVIGSTALVEAATDIAESVGVSQLVIGLTVVAVGTSLPEIATSVLAAMRGERDLAVGNAVGSNLFNIMAVLGLTSLISPSAIGVSPGALSVDMPVMIGVAIACLPIFANGHVIARWEGWVFLLGYLAYVAWLVIDSADHAIRSTYAVGVLGFTLPLTILTFVVIAVRQRRRPAMSG
ncbi:MAG TPA: calcium/sodium antiporter [Ilumatobacter sp.]|nr:calcium/sodium antiporter [Ilumatobacter sp.]